MKTTINPTDGISVILPVYNGSKYLRESIDSIINQTFKNFELIIIDDGSTDNSWDIISSYQHLSNVKMITQENMGLAATLNNGILLSKFNLIARQDQDDVSTLDRFEKQFNFLLNHPDIDIVGSSAIIIEENTISNRKISHPETDNQIKVFLFFDTAFVHSTVIFKKKSVIESGLYSTDPKKQPPEDYELWSRMALTCKFANLPEPLLFYREVGTSMSRTVGDKFINNVISASDAYINGLGENLKLSPINKIFHSTVASNENVNFRNTFLVYKNIWSKIFKKPFNPFEKTASFHLKILMKSIIKHKLQQIKSSQT